MPPLAAPFPWFGGKSRAAAAIWSALGDPVNYVEPFAGSLSVMLSRPPSRHRTVETINDADGFVSNFWRAIAADPEAVARHSDWPVNECDLTARHLWLVDRRAALTERLQVDPHYFDTKVAGWWVWGICSWIGSGWCSGNGPWSTDGERWTDFGDKGRGINRQLPHLGNKGQGINRQLPHLGDKGQGINEWFTALSDRLRGVRVACGDWARVLGDSVTTKHGVTAIVLDPPYPEGFKDAYSAGDDGSVWHAAADWAAESGDNSDLRIVLCGYAGTWTPPPGWREVAWKARGGYGAGNANNENAHRERLWLSPSCNADIQPSLFTQDEI